MVAVPVHVVKVSENVMAFDSAALCQKSDRLGL
jgi:hypothetical protein